MGEVRSSGEDGYKFIKILVRRECLGKGHLTWSYYQERRGVGVLGRTDLDGTCPVSSVLVWFLRTW